MGNLSFCILTSSLKNSVGALVANYPWDGTQDKSKNYFGCPDDDTFRFLASVYSRSHYNMSLSEEFKGGITNGAFWYPIYGGMQDWNYIYGGCFELTLEISDDKWPTANELPILWHFNKMSMLNLVASLVKTGVHGRIFSSDCGRPLPASVAIKGINYTIKASQTFADYHRLLAPGGRFEASAYTSIDYHFDLSSSSPEDLVKKSCVFVGHVPAYSNEEEEEEEEEEGRRREGRGRRRRRRRRRRGGGHKNRLEEEGRLGRRPGLADDGGAVTSAGLDRRPGLGEATVCCDDRRRRWRGSASPLLLSFLLSSLPLSPLFPLFSPSFSISSRFEPLKIELRGIFL
ncbi:hypothetical protein TEA_022611 [Camellia sinensis var. sinensis]|uniref:Peptidase M14 domain-containing protein n=1 Tax=Camellia sinensis var. sinensis TaxID=542762 RepID=A0A4S4DR89_CAMSN|nr:hypothetical protein TEA_022611 [Camellia sinensis var. sinensis]